MKSNLRAQHKAVNSRLKTFYELSSYFWHCKAGQKRMMTKHGWWFGALAVINQLKIEAGEPIFQDELKCFASYF